MSYIKQQIHICLQKSICDRVLLSSIYIYHLASLLALKCYPTNYHLSVTTVDNLRSSACLSTPLSELMVKSQKNSDNQMELNMCTRPHFFLRHYNTC